MARSPAKLHCPTCNAIRPAFSVNPSAAGEKSQRRFYFIEHNDVNFFRRYRKCTACYGIFRTAELEEQFLDELIELRDTLADLKTNAAAYQEHAEKAAERLTALSESLSALRALK